MRGINEIKRIFNAAIEAVKPHGLIKNKIVFSNNELTVGDETFVVNKNCHVIGMKVDASLIIHN